MTQQWSLSNMKIKQNTFIHRFIENDFYEVITKNEMLLYSS